MMKYEVIGSSYTSINADDFATWDEYESALDKFYEDQGNTINAMFPKGDYVIHFFDSAYFNEEYLITDCVDDMYEYLAIKDGCDFVKFENGNYGIVASYSGNENGFEILKDLPKGITFDE